MERHHAVILLSHAPEDYEPLEKNDTDTEVSHEIVDTIGINNIRNLTTEAFRRPQEGYTKKSLILSASKITSEAQQAALKILEEPPSGVFITLILPKGTQLLDTILSRVEIQQTVNKATSNVYAGWLELPYAERIAEVEKRVKAKDSLWLQSFKTDLQSYYSDHTKTIGSEVKEIQLVIEHLLTRGASNKMLLEHLALSAPLTH